MPRGVHRFDSIRLRHDSFWKRATFGGNDLFARLSPEFGIVVQRENVRLAPGQCEFDSRRFHEAQRASFNSRTTVFQTVDVGATPAARTDTSRTSDEERDLQNRVRGFDSLSALHVPIV